MDPRGLILDWFHVDGGVRLCGAEAGRHAGQRAKGLQGEESTGYQRRVG